MNIFIDIIGSWFVRASMVVVMLTLMVNMNDALYLRTAKANARGLAALVDSVMYVDISSADTVVVSNHQDFTLRKTSPTVRYYYTYNSGTQRYSLYRSESSSLILLGNTFTSLEFKYYAFSGSGTVDSQMTSTPYRGIRRVNVSYQRVLPSLRSAVRNLGVADTVLSNDFSVYPGHIF